MYSVIKCITLFSIIIYPVWLPLQLLFTPLPMVSDLALDWVSRRLYIAQIQSTNLVIQALALDNVEMNGIVNKDVASNTMVKITLSPYTGLDI